MSLKLCVLESIYSLTFCFGFGFYFNVLFCLILFHFIVFFENTKNKQYHKSHENANNRRQKKIILVVLLR